MEGIHLVTLPRFTPEDYIKALIEQEPTDLFVVPSLLLFLASHPAVSKEHLKTIKSVISGAAPATEGLLQKFRDKVGRDLLIRQGNSILMFLIEFVSYILLWFVCRIRNDWKFASFAFHANFNPAIQNTNGRRSDTEHRGENY